MKIREKEIVKRQSGLEHLALENRIEIVIEIETVVDRDRKVEIEIENRYRNSDRDRNSAEAVHVRAPGLGSDAPGRGISKPRDAA